MYGENREDVAYMWQNYFDNEENVVEMELAFFIKEEDGRFTRFEEVHQQRAYTEKEVLKMLKKAGFSVLILILLASLFQLINRVFHQKSVEKGH